MDRRAFLEYAAYGGLGFAAVPFAHPPFAVDGPERSAARAAEATLGLGAGLTRLSTPHFDLELVEASQTVASLRPKGAEGFSFTPTDRLGQRGGDGFFHLGDLTLRLRTVRLRMGGTGAWQSYSTAAARRPVEALPASGSVLAAADLGATLPPDLPLRVRRRWVVEGGHLTLSFELTNEADEAVEVGALGIPMVFNNILSDRSLDEAHAECSFYDPYIGRDAGYLQVTRLSGGGPALVVAPSDGTSFEAYRPLLSDPTPRGITFEGFYEWMAHSRAYAEDEWREAEPWNPPTSKTLAPGETLTCGLRFLVAERIRDVEATLLADGHPVAVGVPGYVLPTDLEATLFLKHARPVEAVDVRPAGAIALREGGRTEGGWHRYHLRGTAWGRARLEVTYADGRRQAVHYKVVKPAAEIVSDLGAFLAAEQWFADAGDRFGRAPSFISYDYDAGRQVTEDGRAWIAGLSDEGGAGSWLAAAMKQLVQPDPAQVEKLERFVDETVWGGIQYSEGERKYGVRKSLFYYAPDEMPEGTYSPEVEYGGWSSWDREEARSVERSFNYVHVAAAYWVLYRLARNRDGLVTRRPWDWYLQQASRTAQAMGAYAAHYAQFGQMEGTVFVRILRDLQREGLDAESRALETVMRARADGWEALNYPFGSEMPWDSTGQEEVYAWCDYFGYDRKAQVTLDAILAYMPTVAHWGYNGSARRYWDFMYAGKLARLERQLHHYGSGLNAIPVLDAYRRSPDDLHLLRVGYGGLMGSTANVTPEGFGPCGFHAYPSTLKIDGYSGDYGPNFFGHAMNAGTYLVQHPEFGWLAFGGNLSAEGGEVRVTPLDAARSRLYLAPLGLWLTLDAGMFEEVAVDVDGRAVRLTLAAASSHTPAARLRIERVAEVGGAGGAFEPDETFDVERGAYVIPLTDRARTVRIE